MMNPAISSKAYESGVINSEHHSELVRNIEQTARLACIPVQAVWQSMEGVCSAPVIEYVRHYKQNPLNGVYGLCFNGPMNGTSIQDKMMLIAGACLRNYINARMMTVQDILAGTKKGVYPDVSVLLIPNFFLANNDGGHIPAWQISDLTGLLMKRHAQSLQTVIYVQDMTELESEYGQIFKYHIKNHFLTVAA
jgi:hypothetical protein